MKQLNLFFVFLIALIGLYPIFLPSKIEEELTYELEAPLGLVYDEFYNLRQFSKWEQLTKQDTLTVKRFSDPQEEEKRSMTWESTDAAIGDGKLTMTDFGINQFVDYQIEYEGWDKKDDIHVKFTPSKTGKTDIIVSYVSQEVPYFYRYFIWFKSPLKKFEESFAYLQESVKVRLEKERKEGKLNFGEFRLVDLPKTTLLTVKKETTFAEKDIMAKVDQSFEAIYKSLINEEDSFDYDLGFPHVYYTSMDEAKKKMVIYSGVNWIEDLTVNKTMQKTVIPEGEYLLTLHQGPRSRKKQTIEAMQRYAKTKKFQLADRQLEVFLNDPKETDSLHLQSRIYIPIKKD